MTLDLPLRRLALATLVALAAVPATTIPAVAQTTVTVAPSEITGLGADAPEIDDQVVDRSRFLGFVGVNLLSGVHRPLSSRLGIVAQQDVWAGIGVFGSAQARMVLGGGVLHNGWVGEVGLRRAVRTNIDAVASSGWTDGHHWIGVGANVFRPKDAEAGHEARVGFDLRVGYYPGLRGMMLSGGVIIGHPFAL